MRKAGQLVAALAVAVVVPMAVSTTARAAFECEIGYTAAESQNLCISEQSYNCEISNENKVTVNDETEQDAATGTADVSGNESGGGAVTGEATNTNGTKYTFTINNGGSSNEERVCVAKKVIPAKEVPEAPESPEQPGRGETSAPVQPSQNVTPAALPVTSGDTAPVVFLVGGSVLTAGLAVTYRRMRL